jgi:predicted nucleic acid-binding protein
MLLLISDANIFIDVEAGNLTPVIFKLPYEFAVPDILFELELQKHHEHLLDAGLKVISLDATALRMMESLLRKHPRASIMDHAALSLAMQEHCPLLTGDRDLRIAAQQEGVEVHGTIWVMEKLLEQKLILQQQARTSFASMRVKNSRLPWGDVENLLNRWEFVH